MAILSMYPETLYISYYFLPIIHILKKTKASLRDHRDVCVSLRYQLSNA
jgi:hypothetical protein